MTGQVFQRATEIQNALTVLREAKAKWENFRNFHRETWATLWKTNETIEESIIPIEFIDIPALKKQVLVDIQKETELLIAEFNSL